MLPRTIKPTPGAKRTPPKAPIEPKIKCPKCPETKYIRYFIGIGGALSGALSGALFEIRGTFEAAAGTSPPGGRLLLAAPVKKKAGFPPPRSRCVRPLRLTRHLRRPMARGRPCSSQTRPCIPLSKGTRLGAPLPPSPAARTAATSLRPASACFEKDRGS